MDEVRRSYCGLCHPRCGTLLHFKEDRVVKVTGNPDHPVTCGAICERDRLMPDHLYHSDRLNHPLKRIGDNGGVQGRQSLIPSDFLPKWCELKNRGQN